MDKSWLQTRITVEEAEAKHSVRNDRLGPEPVPFGFINSRWKALLEQMQPGDELWEFSSSGASWERLAGRAGIVLLRNGEEVASLLTVMN